MSILSSLRYCLGPADDHTNMYIALAFIPFGLFFDFMDGKVARWRGKSSLMGQELDSLADEVWPRCDFVLLFRTCRCSKLLQISFGVAPATAAFALGLRTPLDAVFLSFFVLCGLTRLARFNVTVAAVPKDATGKSKYFEGFPIPTSLGIVLGMAIATSQGVVEGGQKGVFGGLLAEELLGGLHPIVAVFVLWGFLMVSKTIHIPKP